MNHQKALHGGTISSGSLVTSWLAPVSTGTVCPGHSSDLALPGGVSPGIAPDGVEGWDPETGSSCSQLSCPLEQGVWACRWGWDGVITGGTLGLGRRWWQLSGSSDASSAERLPAWFLLQERCQENCHKDSELSGGSVRQIDDPWAWSCCHYFQESAGKAIFCCLKRWHRLLECFHITDLQQLNIVLLCACWCSWMETNWPYFSNWNAG